MDEEARTLTIRGEVDRPIVLRYEELLALPAIERRVPITCAGGGVSDTVMTGVPLTQVFDLAMVRETARLAVFACSDGHEETIPLAELIQQEAFLAYRVEGEEVEEAGPHLRLSIPGKLGSKWAKWVHRIELV